jgi:transcriptional regulator with PAS, ATPase and Fis domain
MDISNAFYSASRLTVGQMMNTNFKSLHLDDTLKTVVEYYQKYKISTLPVVDESQNLIGVMPRKRLYKALLEGCGLDTPCAGYIVKNPVFVTIDRIYDEYSLVARVTESRVDSVAVLDLNGKLAGMIGTAEYLQGSLNVITTRLQTEINYYRDELKKSDNSRLDHILTNNTEFMKIKKEAALIARSSSTVLLTGESGVGKDMFARGIHEASPRAKNPFIKVNCVSIPDTLFESELFGYAPGSFTGALKNGKSGYFERADTGTIFLDEIGDMPMPIQAKLLQVLQEKEFVRVGGTKKQTVDIRIIAATNRNLREAISDKSFREDLYYRLNVIEFHLPPLRDKPDDIIILAKSFIEKYNRILGSKVTGISRQAQEALQNYSWPGNVRELENAIERAANYVWEGEINIENLPGRLVKAESNSGAERVPYHKSLEDFQKEILLDALERANGNRSAAAKLLNLSRSAFYGRLNKYDIR